MNNLSVIILAAGKGTRMESPLPKVLHSLAGRPLLEHVINRARSVSPDRIVTVIGYKGGMVKERFSDSGVVFAVQEEQLGTGHAVAQAESSIADSCKDVLVLSGDVPMLRHETLMRLLRGHRKSGAAVSFISTTVPDPSGYGRVVRDAGGRVSGIVEEGDAGPEIKAIQEINAGIYCFTRVFLFKTLKGLTCDNVQAEYYLTDVVREAVRKGEAVEAVEAVEWREVMGINTQDDLAGIMESFET